MLLRKKWPAIRFSSMYRSAARDYEKQEDFLNAVAMLETTMPPEEAFGALQGMEKELGKKTPFRYGPRVIDLDLLLYGESVLPSPKEWLSSYSLPTTHYPLFVPHPRMH
ncbi:MAG: 2-amino-4-hydroxy-6-hydroxymethyldihydropteridine diphosphokinase, partial [Patescibacteria group bacterium]